MERGRTVEGWGGRGKEVGQGGGGEEEGKGQDRGRGGEEVTLH